MEMEMGGVDVEEMVVVTTTTTTTTTSGLTLRSSRGSCYKIWMLDYPKAGLKPTQ